MPYKSNTTLSRPGLRCDWSVERHWCHVQHQWICARSLSPGTRSVAYLMTAGRLGNSMFTLALLMSLQKLGFTPVINLVNYQILNDIFSNIDMSGVMILEEMFCDPASVTWTVFDKPLKYLQTDEMSSGKQILFWPSGVSVDESVHGVVSLLTPLVPEIRNVFTMR